MLTDETNVKQSIFDANDSIWSIMNLEKHLKDGLYEAWYTIINNLEKEESYWIRFSLMCPENPELAKKSNVSLEEIDAIGGGARLWFGFFSAKDPKANFLVKKIFSLKSLEETSMNVFVKINDSELSLDGTKGNFKTQKGKEIAWDLKFSKFMEAYIGVPVMAHKLKLTNTLLHGSHPNMRISGIITIDGIQTKLNGVPGIQYHTFGDGYKIPWEWMNVHTFKENSDAFFDLGYKINKGTIGFFDGIEEYFIWNQHPLKKFAMMKKINRTKSLTDCKFNLDYERIQINGEIKVSQDSLLGIEYKGPQGNFYYCYNTEVANAILQLIVVDRQGNKIKEKEYHAENSVTFETVYEEPQPGIPYLPWDQEDL